MLLVSSKVALHEIGLIVGVLGVVVNRCITVHLRILLAIAEIVRDAHVHLVNLLLLGGISHHLRKLSVIVFSLEHNFLFEP